MTEKHLDAELHTRGTSLYVDDVAPPAGMLHAAIYGSPVAHGRVKALRLDEARNAPGVVAIYTGEDVPGENQIGPVLPDEPLLATDLVEYHGHPMAMVVAETPEDARHALTLIEVDIEPLDVITCPRVAHEAGHILGTPRTFAMGDTTAAFADCDIVVEGRSDVGGQEHLYLETQRARAVPTEGDRIRVYSSTQSPYAVQKACARILGLPTHRVEVDVIRLGGGFGGKEDQATSWACLAALACQITGRPTQLVLHRLDDLRMTGKRHPYSADYKIGLSKEGKILAFEVKHFQNAGAKTDLSLAVLERTLFHSTNSYFIPNVRAYAASCRTNLPPNTAFRGFGGPQGMFVIESAIAHAAEVMGVDRSEIQKKNLIQEGQSFPYGQQAERARARRTWEEAETNFEIGSWQKEIADYNAKNAATKKGLAAMPICFGISFTATFLNQASALMHVYTDGSVSLSTGGVEMGQGLSSKLVRIAAQALRISPHRIKVETTNTTRIANMSPSAASATTDLNGSATILAAEELRRRFRELLARELGVQDAENITFEDEKVFYCDEPTDWTWEKLVAHAYLSRVSLSAHAFFATPNVWFDKQKETGRPFAYHVFGTAWTEVTVDMLRGTYTVDRVRLVHDLGRTLNENVDLGQIEGGLAQGIGWMTLEELAFAEDGRLTSHALSTYKAPDGDALPDEIDVRLLEDADNPVGPFGSKAVGEPPLMYGIGTFFALRAALRAAAPEAELAFNAPMTPEKVMMQLHHNRLRTLWETPPTSTAAPAAAGE
ncbi:molybdopterin-dependent oxidoreductase [Lujinxingia vulgaris]|uniref:Molybdopterin-dependent oxidoreductase n=1 Tax=Lujinxingia vulgaris TaxID=2600176 RepID=A0A5C6X0X5_9DELT|nr:molybdopterin cofactor-binding domain-containing protein [Lujinxingia vulgaris]TXD33853.1 molybdopterin-dependent oxidoreductase [Lujinxingia vulgaris]